MRTPRTADTYICDRLSNKKSCIDKHNIKKWNVVTRNNSLGTRTFFPIGAI